MPIVNRHLLEATTALGHLGNSFLWNDLHYFARGYRGELIRDESSIEEILQKTPIDHPEFIVVANFLGFTPAGMKNLFMDLLRQEEGYFAWKNPLLPAMEPPIKLRFADSLPGSRPTMIAGPNSEKPALPQPDCRDIVPVRREACNLPANRNLFVRAVDRLHSWIHRNDPPQLNT